MAWDVGVEVVYDILPEVIARFPGAVDTVQSAGAERIAQYARDNHPWQNRTGKTEASIHVERGAAHEFAVVFGGASIFLEWGTVNMPPFPYIQPAFDAVRPSIDDGLSRLESKLV